MGIAIGEGRVSQMSDNLRDRIKEEVLDGILSMFSENDSVEMAAGYITDAVIREMELREELRYPNRLPHYTFMPPQRTRYVTGWESCDER